MATGIDQEIERLTKLYWDIAKGTPAYIARELGVTPIGQHSHREIQVLGLLRYPGGREPLRISVSDSSFDGAMKKLQWDCLLQINEWIRDKENESKEFEKRHIFAGLTGENSPPQASVNMATFTTGWLQHLLDNDYEVHLTSHPIGISKRWSISIRRPNETGFTYSQFGGLVECLTAFKQTWEADRRKNW